MKHFLNTRETLRKSIFSLILFSVVLYPSFIWAEPARQFVLEAYPKWYSDKHFTVQGNIGIEKNILEYDWIEMYIKPSFAYALDDNWALHGGLGYYYSDYKIMTNTYELRPFLGISYFTDLGTRWGISAYFRSEERYRYSIGNDDRTQSTRLRLRLRGTYRLNPASLPNSWHKVIMDLEEFKSYNTDAQIIRHTFDYETHVTLGIERTLSEKRKVRFELAWKYLAVPDAISHSSVNTVYFKIQYFPIWGELLHNKLRHRDINE